MAATQPSGRAHPWPPRTPRDACRPDHHAMPQDMHSHAPLHRSLPVRRQLGGRYHLSRSIHPIQRVAGPRCLLFRLSALLLASAQVSPLGVFLVLRSSTVSSGERTDQLADPLHFQQVFYHFQNKYSTFCIRGVAVGEDARKNFERSRGTRWCHHARGLRQLHVRQATSACVPVSLKKFTRRALDFTPIRVWFGERP